MAVQDVNDKALKLEPDPLLGIHTASFVVLLFFQLFLFGLDQAKDIITGFQVIDKECTILCLEGLADKGMKLLESRVQVNNITKI